MPAALVADAGSVAVEAVILASIVVPLSVFGVICWIFWRAKKRDDEAARLRG